MALSTLSTAWCSYQSSKWNSLSNDYATQADHLQRRATALHIEGNQVMSVHALAFMEVVDAKLAGNEKLVRFYTDRFSPDLHKAYEGWLAQKPFDNPQADPSPFVPHLYRPRFSTEMHQALADSEHASVEAKKTGQIAAKYLGNTVLLAMVLFFAGTSAKFDQRHVRHGALFFAVTIFLYTVARMVELPGIGGIVSP